MFDKIKNIFKKEETFSCVIFDGKMMKYMDLTQKQIDEIKNDAKYKDWTIQKKEEC
ncbi:hypothetical protein GCM10012288_09550 [Malaciobacter pacificus]|uniref:Uncharacterized protein n=1 Tax=Malaciobacter pacificus TaxID=1080223 RepID=A0A5C2H6M2_9BACT|nr:hypothetical protein [Malaciobacter pacificus]QEP34597.1 hypothetical protein APAC_1488 [Malaciobacter pacificus]GGD37526.1 hypothetical protein GCM10012288_09550 [Malaciobacter pacificus]